MAKPELLQALSSLNKRIESLLLEQTMLKDTISSLNKEIEELKLQKQLDKETIDKANQKIEFLSLSYRLANSPEALTKARMKISSLIRTIDTCIRLINED